MLFHLQRSASEHDHISEAWFVWRDAQASAGTRVLHGPHRLAALGGR
jgi:hypothetical protein